MNVMWDEVDAAVPQGHDDADMRGKHVATPSKPLSCTQVSREQGGTGFDEAVIRFKEQLAYDASAAQNGATKFAVDDLNKDIWRQNLASAFLTLLLQITDAVDHSHRQLALSLSSAFSPKPATDLSLAMSTLPNLGPGGALQVEGIEVELDMTPPRSPRDSGSRAASPKVGTRIHPHYQYHSRLASSFVVSEDSLAVVDSPKPKKSTSSFFGINISRSFGFKRRDEQKKKYHVEDMYSTHGIFQAVARSTMFSNITLIVIILSAIYFGIAADWNDAQHAHNEHSVFIIADNLFCSYFTAEILIRVLAFRRTSECLRDGCFRFDLALVVFMCIETWIFPTATHLISKTSDAVIPVEVLRLKRLSRLTRLSRLIRSVPEMVTIMNSLWAGARAVLSCIMLIATATYIFAIALHAIMANEVQMNERLHQLTGRSFKSIGNCMWILTIDGTFLLDTHLLLTELLFSKEWHAILACFIFLAFVLVSSVTFMNMLVGVLVEVVSKGAIAEREEQATQLIQQKIIEELRKIDDGDGKITKEELLAVMHDSEWHEVLDSLGIDRLYLAELQVLFFPPGQDSRDIKIDIKAVMQLMLMCRCSLPCTVEHMSNAQAALLCILDDTTSHLENEIASHCEQIASLVKVIERRTREPGVKENLSQAPAPKASLEELADNGLLTPRVSDSFDFGCNGSKENTQEDADENRWDI